MPTEEKARWATIEWLMFQMGGVGPFFGQVHHFTKYNSGVAPYAEERYLKENARIYGVLDKRLGEGQYLAGDYSIADIATWPWIARHPRQQMSLFEYPNLLRWYLEIAARPAVQRGYIVPKHVEDIPVPEK